MTACLPRVAAAVGGVRCDEGGTQRRACAFGAGVRLRDCRGCRDCRRG
jgi:hypothetical protein